MMSHLISLRHKSGEYINKQTKQSSSMMDGPNTISVMASSF